MRLQEIKVRELLYLFKYEDFKIWFDQGNSGTDTMDWDTTWKYCRERNLLDALMDKAYFFDNTINIMITGKRG